MGEHAIWQAEGAQKRAAVQGMFAEIAPTYDLLNSILSLRRHHLWRRLAVRRLELAPGQTALDVCTGTGDFLAPLRRAVGQAGQVVGIDFCLPMLELAATKATGSGLATGDACRLPIRENAVDGVSVGWGIRNVPDVDAAHRELFRVLKPGGRFVSLDMAQPRNRVIRGFGRVMFHRVVPWIGARFGRAQAYTYLPKSTERFFSREQLRESMERAGFVDVTWKDLFFGNICLHVGRKP